jgi:hypothetical protein
MNHKYVSVVQQTFSRNDRQSCSLLYLIHVFSVYLVRTAYKGMIMSGYAMLFRVNQPLRRTDDRTASIWGVLASCPRRLLSYSAMGQFHDGVFYHQHKPAQDTRALNL